MDVSGFLFFQRFEREAGQIVDLIPSPAFADSTESRAASSMSGGKESARLTTLIWSSTNSQTPQHDKR